MDSFPENSPDQAFQQEVMNMGFRGSSSVTAGLDKATIVSQWITEISLEQQKVSRFYIYMLDLVNEEMEVLKELAKMYFDRRCFPDTGTSFVENI